MTVTETLMEEGSWALQLKPGTPGEVLDALGDYQILRIYPGKVDVTVAAQGGGTPRYAGVVLERPDPWSLAGAGPWWYLGSPDGKVGPVITGTSLTFSPGTISQWVDALKGPLTLGPMPSGVTFAGSFSLINFRAVLGYILYAVGCEAKIDPTFYISVGRTQDLYGTIPAAIAIARNASSEHDISAVRATQLKLDRSTKDRVWRVFVNSGTTRGAGAGGDPGFKGPDGSTLDRTKIVDLSDGVDPTSMTPLAVNMLAMLNNPARSVTISSDAYDIGALVDNDAAVPHGVGRWLHVYDPDQGLFDLSNSVPFSGRILHPIMLRVMSQTWPVRQGMGVYVTDPASGATTDLTRWFVPESSDATLQVGALSPRIGF